MKVNTEECVEVLHLTGQHMSPPSLARPKSGMGSIVVDMGNRGEVDVRGVDLYSPNKKSARPEPVSRIHLIPLLMIFVFFILWAGSTEIPLKEQSSEDAIPELFVMRMPTPNKFTTAAQLKGFNHETSQHGTRIVMDHDHTSHHKHASHAFSEKTYVRGVTR